MQKIDIRSEGSALLPCPAPGNTEASLRPEPQNSKRAARPCRPGGHAGAAARAAGSLPGTGVHTRPCLRPGQRRGQLGLGLAPEPGLLLTIGSTGPPPGCHRGRPTSGAVRASPRLQCLWGSFGRGPGCPGAQSPPGARTGPVSRGPAVPASGVAPTWALSPVQLGAGAACRLRPFPPRAGLHPLGFSPGTAGAPPPTVFPATHWGAHPALVRPLLWSWSPVSACVCSSCASVSHACAHVRARVGV